MMFKETYAYYFLSHALPKAKIRLPSLDIREFFYSERLKYI